MDHSALGRLGRWGRAERPKRQDAGFGSFVFWVFLHDLNGVNQAFPHLHYICLIGAMSTSLLFFSKAKK